MGWKSGRNGRLRAVSALVVGSLLGAVMLAPVSAGPNDPATKRFVNKKFKKLKAQIASKADAAAVYTKAETDARLTDGFVASREGPFLPGGANFVGQLVVPAGTYVVQAKLVANNPTNNGDVTCSLHGGGSKLDETRVTVGGASGIDNVAIALLGALNTALDGTVIEARCTPGPGFTTFSSLRIAATGVSDLVSVPAT